MRDVNDPVEVEFEEHAFGVGAAPVVYSASTLPVPVDTREDWGAKPPKSNPGGFASLDATVCHYTAANKGYMVELHEDHEICRSQVRSIQVQHQNDSSQSDISYNALVCGHGVLFEGRVLGYKGGANGTGDTNLRMPSICALVGVDDIPTDEMLYTIQVFHAAVEQKSGRFLDMMKHKEIVSTSCPGDFLSDWVDTGKFRLDEPIPEPTPPTPIPTPGEDDMPAPDVVRLSEPYGGQPENAIFICSPDFQTHRHVKDEDEYWQLVQSFNRHGWSLPDNPGHVAAIPAAWMKQYGVLLD